MTKPAQTRADYVASLTAQTPSQLALAFNVAGESLCEEEIAVMRDFYRGQVAMIQAVGRFIHGVAFDEAVTALDEA